MSDSPAPDGELDLRGTRCPHNSSAAIIELELMDVGELLRVLIDDGEPIVNVPLTLVQEGHEVISLFREGEHWMLLVRRGDDV
ncbi:MAG: sulfurtransferase TusA family protein [Myxococcota bacterium]|jgi:TusA-related sulfurtransferase|nr:sulfurtransferase TusA family protein [Myxococcota bacterium]